ncbi:MAG: cation:proton antiporter [Candidatus Hydrothermarchaeales archaeon]
MADMVLIVSYFSFLLGLGVIVANLFKKYKIPDAFILLLVGLVCGPTIWKHPAVASYIQVTIVDVEAMSAVPDFLRTLALVIIVFTGAFNLDFKELKRVSDVSINLAFILVFLNTVFLGLAAKFIFKLDLVPALLIGAILSGTDAGVVFTYEKVLKKKKKALSILKVESILNSPLSVLIPILLLDLLRMAPGSIIEPLLYVSQFWQMIIGGIGSGVVLGFVLSKILNKMLKEYKPLLIFSMALLTYAFTELVHGSGMLAVAVAGFIIGNLVFPHKDTVREFHDEFSEMLRISVFTLMGAQIALNLNPYLILVEFLFALLVFFIRPIFVIFLARDLKEEMDYESLSVVKFLAPRGISAAAMAPIAAGAIATGNQEIMNIVFTAVFFTLLFNTITVNLINSGKMVAWKERYELAKVPVGNFFRGKYEDLRSGEKEEKITDEEGYL